jgi:hypothetical protein
LRFQGIFLHNPFARSWCLHLLGNFLVACICAWRNVPDDIEKVVTDGTGPKEVMGGSEHSKNEFADKNNDMNANDQYK